MFTPLHELRRYSNGAKPRSSSVNTVFTMPDPESSPPEERHSILCWFTHALQLRGPVVRRLKQRICRGVDDHSDQNIFPVGLGTRQSLGVLSTVRASTQTTVYHCFTHPLT